MSAEKEGNWTSLKEFVLLLGSSAVVIGAVWGFYQALKMLFV